MERDNERLKAQGKELINQKNYQAAIEVLSQMDDMDWGKPFHLGRAYYFMGNAKEALMYFADYYGRHVVDGGYWMAQCYETLGETRKAAEAYEGEIAWADNLDTDLCLRAGRLWKQLGEIERAKCIWYKGLQYEWEFRTNRDVLKNLCFQLGRLELERQHIDVGVWYMCQLAILGDTEEEENLARQGFIRQEDNSFISQKTQYVYYPSMDGLMDAEARYYYTMAWKAPAPKEEPIPEPVVERPAPQPAVAPQQAVAPQPKAENKVDKMKKLFGGFLK